MNKKLVLFVLFLFYYQPVFAEQWVWQKECVPAENTTCEVWFNDLRSYDAISARAKDADLVTEYKGYTETPSPSAAFMLVQTNDLSDSQLQNVKNGLLQWVRDTTPSQQMALYLNDDTLNPLSLLGATPRNLRKAISTLAVSDNSAQEGRNLVKLLTILGGVSVERKVVFWITTGATLNSAEINQIKSELSSEKIRLVIVHLTLSELSINTASTLQKLGMESGSIFLSLKPENLKNHAKSFAGFTNNGGSIVFDTKDLCGNVKIQLKATGPGHQQVLDQAIELSYAACPELPVEPVPPVVVEEPTPVPAPDVPVEETTEETSEQNTEGTDEQATEGSTEGTTEGTTDQTTEETGEQSTDEEGNSTEPAPVDPVDPVEDPKGLTGVVIASLAGLGILALLVLVFFIRKKSNNENKCFGFLTKLDSEQSGRYDLQSSGSKIGRSHQNDIVLDDEAVSAHHAVIKMERDGLVRIIDLNSSNGIIVNGEDVDAQTVLNSSDIIEIGESKFRVSFL